MPYWVAIADSRRREPRLSKQPLLEYLKLCHELNGRFTRCNLQFSADLWLRAEPFVTHSVISATLRPQVLGEDRSSAAYLAPLLVRGLVTSGGREDGSSAEHSHFGRLITAEFASPLFPLW